MGFTFSWVLFFSVFGMRGFCDAASYPVHAKIGCLAAPQSPWAKGSARFAQLVTERTKGQVVVKSYPASQLGSNSEMAMQLSSGDLEFLMTDHTIFSNVDRRADIYNAPFMFRDADEEIAFAKSPVAIKFRKAIEKKAGVLFLSESGWMPVRNVISRKPIRSINDMKGLKIRTPPTKLYIETFKALGANPISIGYADIYVSLSQGLVDAMEGPLGSLVRSRAYEVCKNVAFTKHMSESLTVVANTKFYKSLKPEYQKIIKQSANDALAYASDLYKKEDVEKEKQLREAGVKFTHPDLAPFKAATEGVLKEEYPAKFVDAVEAELEIIRKGK